VKHFFFKKTLCIELATFQLLKLFRTKFENSSKLFKFIYLLFHAVGHFPTFQIWQKSVKEHFLNIVKDS